jgi:putative toxin-antitoxin system antitoxin component (TIGR02293 family)
MRAKCHNYKDKWRILNKEAIKLKESVSEHILQIERTVDVGQDVFGDPELFLRWLRQSCEALGGKLPVELLGSITGARLVRDVLVRIDYGVPY